MKTLAERLKHARTEARLPQAALARLAGIGQSTLASIENGRNHSSAKLVEIARELGVRVEWLAKGEGPMRDGQTSEADGSETLRLSREIWPLPAIPRERIEALAPAQLERLQGAIGLTLTMLDSGLDVAPPKRVSGKKAANDDTYVAIPKLPIKIAATISGVALDQVHVGEMGQHLVQRSWIQEGGLAAECLFAVEVKGLSMFPRIHEGDIVVVNIAARTPVAGKVYAFNHEGEFTLKRAERRNNRWYLVSSNQEQKKFPPVPCTDDTSVIGRVELLMTDVV